MVRIILKTLLIIILLSSKIVYPDDVNLPGYDLTDPDVSIIFPDILHEVSGLTYIDDNTIACIQDENGIIFIYDVVKNLIIKQYVFNVDGDYEGITRVDNTLYILKSDGVLFEISDYQSKNLKLNSYYTGIPAKNNEGLCYDEANKQLLIACKGKIGKGPGYKDKRVIYGFDLTTKTLTKDPIFEFDIQFIKKFALNNKINLPTKKKKQKKLTEINIKFKTSAICIHPFTNKLYLISDSDHLIFIFNMNGDIENIGKLDAGIFNKAEGITFLKNGDMLITNEGQDKRPTLLRFNYK